MKYIDLNTRKISKKRNKPLCRAIVDDDDYDRLSKYSWLMSQPKKYVRRTDVDNDRKNVSIHREIMKVTDKSIQIDHINGNTLDNRKQNLRVCTSQQNSFNRKKTNNRWGFKGVAEIKKYRCRKWRATITLNRIKIPLGRFYSIEEAARAYDDKAKELFGEFAALNFR